MKLYYKLALINSVTRILIVAAFLVFAPTLIYKAAVTQVDSNLQKKKTKFFDYIVARVGMNEFMAKIAEDSSYSDYTIFKENYISVEPGTEFKDDTIFTSPRDIEGDIVQCRVLQHCFFHNNSIFLLEIGESIQYARDINSILKRVALYLLLAIVIITVLLDLGIAQYLFYPLRKLEQKFLATRRPEKFNFAPIKTTTTDFRYLDNAISEMMHKIQDAFNIEKEFIANVSHELLTPVSILQTRLENLLASANLSEEAQVKLIESEHTLGRLKQIIRSLLLISQIENKQPPKTDRVDMPELLKEVAAEIEDRLSDKNITLTLHTGASFALAQCNRSLLFTMFFNLVNNAVKYNKLDGTITLSAGIAGDKYEVSVMDSGIGIEPENIQSIFFRFKKFNAAGEESYGLGLPMVKTIADFHQADLLVESEPGKGSKFIVRFGLK